MISLQHLPGKPVGYGAPINQLSLIYLVKEQPVVKTRSKHTTRVCLDLTSLLRVPHPIKITMVELCGIEPQTSCVQGRRSPS
jgi:hypothetical protein